MNGGSETDKPMPGTAGCEAIVSLGQTGDALNFEAGGNGKLP